MSTHTSAGGAPAPRAPSAEADKQYEPVLRGCLPWLLGLLALGGITIALILRFGDF
jgi:hypothetical protein